MFVVVCEIGYFDQDGVGIDKAGLGQLQEVTPDCSIVVCKVISLIYMKIKALCHSERRQVGSSQVDLPSNIQDESDDSSPKDALVVSENFFPNISQQGLPLFLGLTGAHVLAMSLQ